MMSFVIVFSGSELVSLLCADPTLTDVTQQNTVLELTAEQKAKGRVKVVKCGDITLRGGGRIHDQDDKCADITVRANKSSGKNAIGNDSVVDVDAHRSAQQKVVDEAYEELHNSTPEVFLLSVNTAKGLLYTDTLKHRYACCL